MATVRQAFPARQGFTLLEVLVVLLIMGLLVGLVSAMVLPDERALLQVESERLARLLELAADEARLRGGTVAWTAEPGGYRFWQRQGETGWTAVAGTDLFRNRVLPKGMVIATLRIENTVVAGPMRLEFGSDGAASAFAIGMRLGAEHANIDASPIGEIVAVLGQGDVHAALAQP